MCGFLADRKEKRRIELEKRRIELENFRSIIKEKRWDKSLSEYIENRGLNYFWEQEEYIKSLFRDMIKEQYGIKLDRKQLSWAWDEIVDELERIKRRKEALMKQLMRDIEDGNFDEFLSSFVREHKGYWKNKRKEIKQEFLSLFFKRYGISLTSKEASPFWDKINQIEKAEFEKKQKEKGLVKLSSGKKEKWVTPEQLKKSHEMYKKLKQDLKNNRFDDSLLLIMKKNVGLWENGKKQAKQKFQSKLSRIYGFYVSVQDASKFWNKIYKTQIHRLIDLQSEIKKLGEPSVSRRLTACKRLGMLKDRKAIRSLLEALKDRELEIQVASAKALSEIGDPIALADIRKLENKISNKIIKINNEIDRVHKKNFTRYDRYNRFRAENMRQLEVDTLIQKKEPLSDAHRVLLRAIDKLKKTKFVQMAKVTENNLRKMDWRDFQDKVVEELDGVPSDKKVADMGIDGITLSGIPIQVKQSDNVGRNVVDNFETALRRYYPTSKKIKKGIIVAFSFTKGAYNEAQRAHLEDKIKIDLVTTEELIE